MVPTKFLAAGLLVCTAALAGPAMAASRVLPAAPLPFEPVNLRMTVDSCAFNPESVFVATTAGAIQVRLRDNQCLLPGPPKDVDVRLGAFPVGTYNVEVTTLAGDIVNVLERLQFTIQPRVEIAIFPPPAHPLTDYTGIWWNPQESGWGLSIYQSARDTVFAALFVYDAQNRAQWFTIQPGGWTSSTRWTGIVYRTTGPHFAGPDFDPRLVLVQAAGNAVLEFDTAPAGATTARFTYTIDGVTTVKTITRMGL